MSRFARCAAPLLCLALGAPAFADDKADAGSDAPTLATKKALGWLKKQQQPNGAWLAARESDSLGTTGLVLLSFLWDGNTHRFGTYKRVVNKGLRLLKRGQQADGSIGYDAKDPATLENHVLATWALADGYAISRDFTLKRYAEKALAFLLKQGDPKLGWSFSKQHKSESLATAWAGFALKAAKTSGLKVPDEAWTRIRAHFAKVTDAKKAVGQVAAGDAVLEGMTSAKQPLGNALAYITRIWTGERRSALREVLAPVLKEGGQLKGTVGDYLYSYFGTYSLFQAGGEAWKAWAARIPDNQLIGLQSPEGHWSARGGKVKRSAAYTTALATLTVEILARYERAQGR